MDLGGGKMNMIQLVFPEGKRKAFTVSYDDGVKQDERLLRLMNQYKIKGTFNLNAGLLGKKEHAIIDGFDTDVTRFNKEEIAVMYQGQEVAAHALTHSKLTDISVQTVTYQILEDRRSLEELVNGFVLGFAYPFGLYDDIVIQSLKSCGIEYARTVNRSGSFQLPDDFYKWHPTCHHNDSDLLQLVEKFIRQDKLFGSPQLFYLWGHSYEFDQRNNWDVIEKVFAFLSQYHDDIWMATIGEICNYVNQFKLLKFSTKGDWILNPTAYKIWLLADNCVHSIQPGQKLIIN